ncbi:MAG: ABC transporter ATP-binding protein [Patescibacteria group bacterium]
MQNPTLRVLSLLKDHKKKVFILVCFVIFASFFDITVPFISQKLIDNLISFFENGGASPVGILIFSAIGILIATVLSRIIESIYAYHVFKTVTKIEDKIRNETFEKYLRLHVLFHHGSSSGQIIGRIDRGSAAIYIILYEIFGYNLLPPLTIFTGVLIALLFKNPWIALVTFLPLPFYIIAIQKLTKKIYEIEKRANEESEAVSKEAYDVAGNVLTVKKFSQEHAETETQARLQAQVRSTQYSAERLWIIIENIQTLVATTGRIIVILVGGFFVIQGRSTIGEFVLYVTLQNMAYAPLAQLSVIFPRLRRNTARVERLFAILDEPIHITNKPNALSLPPFEKAIEFKNVSFRYSKKGSWAAKNLNLVIPVGNTVALVGRSGSGKTTFINLLLRSYDPQKGSICVDGHDLRDIERETLLAQIAVVPQEVDLFSRKIAENIAYGKPNVSRKDIERAAKTALAHDFIVKAEKGYDTVVGERGIKLSGGERQRVGIARAVLRDPRILILDEATSHLDTESEQLISRATNALIKNRTTIIIAHRLSTVLHADAIVVFRNGEIEAVGTHAKLLKSSPTYKKLYSLQFSD